MKIYIALPISGRNYDDVVRDIENYKSRFKYLGYEVLNPMTGKSYLRNEIEFKPQGYDNPVSTNHAIYSRDTWMVRQCDVALFDFWYATQRVSIGMAMELAIASELGKHTVSILQPDNIHRHAFILEASDMVFESPSEAYEYLAKLSGGTI